MDAFPTRLVGDAVPTRLVGTRVPGGRDEPPQGSPGLKYHTVEEFENLEDGEFFDEEATDDEDWDDAEEDGAPQKPSYGIRRLLQVGSSARDLPQWEDARGWDEHLRRGHVTPGAMTSTSPPRTRGEAAACAAEMALTISEGSTVHSEHEDFAYTASGSFEKRSPSWVDGWRERLYVLRERKLLYFSPDLPDRPLGILDFGLVRFELRCFREEEEMYEAENKEFRRCCDDCASPLPPGWVLFYLRPLLFQKRVFCFRGTQAALEPLLAKLTALAASSALRGCGQYRRDAESEREVVRVDNFWRYPFIREADFLAEVDTGDLVLFRGTDRAAKLQRAATRSEYDHVGLLLRVASGQVMLLEATGNLGVNMVPWRYFRERGWYRLYDRIAYRKVYFKRSHTQMLAMKTYIQSVLGNQYGLTVSKLLMHRSISGEFDENGAALHRREADEGDLEPRTFFCSELCAACLKRCGVLAGSQASCSFWPGSFSQGAAEPLPLQEHAFVGEEQLILEG